MQDVVCYLISPSYISDNIGNQIVEEIKQETPIIKIQDIGMKEFYEAHEKGLKPSLQLKISSLNYSGQKKLMYMNTMYTIIRKRTPNANEIILVCERKESDG